MKNNYFFTSEERSSKAILNLPLRSVLVRLYFFMMCFILAFSLRLNAQVIVTGSTGANSTYTTLKAAFDAINTNTNQTGNNIVISLTANTTELAPAILNQPTGGSWTTLTISPGGGAARSITGALAFPLIGLNGADNVTIDGLNTGGDSLTITNTSISSTGASTIVFYADATNNTIKNCTIAGSSTSATLATIGFSTGTTTGNDGNTITGCTIKSAGANLPFNAIGSTGTSSSIDNSGISITNNIIKDYYSPGSPSNGIFISANSSAWTIIGNKFFQTATRTSTAGATHRAINIITASGGGYNISNNTIGYSASAGTGITTYAGGFANQFIGIELTAAAMPVSNIQGNTIAAISLATTSGATLAPGIFAGISVLAGGVNIGTTTGNTIGAASGIGSISITTTTTLPYFAGIYTRSTGIVSIQNNTIASIITGGTPSIGYSFYGINTAGAGGNFTISSNTIGSTATPNSITIGTNGTTTGICKFNGITNIAKGTISITGNTIQNCSSYGTGASLFTGIEVDSASTGGTLTITTNNIISGTNSGTGAFTGISNTSAPSIADINNNIIRSNTISSASGSFTGIINTGALTATINMKNNQMGNSTGDLITFSAASSGTFAGISNTGGASTSALVITGNDFRGIIHSFTGAGDHSIIVNTANTLSQNISSNTFTNLNVNTTGNFNFISNDVALLSATGSVIANNNSIITAFTKGSGGAVFLYYTTYLPSSVPGSTKTESNNNFSNITLTGATIISGWADLEGAVSGGSTKTISGNNFSNWTLGSAATTVIQTNYSGGGTTLSNDTISNISSSGPIEGINIGGNNVGTESINSSIINALVTSGAFTVSGVSSAGGVTASIQKIYKNKIFDIQANNAAGSVNGILISAGGTHTIYNNLIGNLVAPATSSTLDAIRGISITSTASNSTNNIFYNTVYLNASSTGTNFGTSGIFHAANIIATTSTLNLRNNIIVNLSTPSGTGLTIAYRRSVGTANNLANYANTSNNNLFSAGAPSATKLIYSDGVSSAQTMAAYMAGVFTSGTIAPRDVASVTDNPNFLSIIGSSTNFLHINNTFATQIESGAVNIPTFSDDFDGNIREGNGGYVGTGTSPDIGADEFNGIPNDLIPPTISYGPLGNTACLITDTLSATITDGTGVNTSTGTKPRIWFKKKSNSNTLPGTNTSATNGWKYAEATNSSSPFSLTIDYSLLNGGVAAGDTIQYFVVAQDIVSPTHNVGINSGIFALTPASVALTAPAFPITGNISSYRILPGLSGAVSIGTTGTYSTLTGPSGLFAAINANGLSGNLTAKIMSNITETGTVALNSIAYGCALHYSLTIKPDIGITAALTGSSASALIKLNGADYVTIDGSNSGGTTKDLTINNTSINDSSAVIWLGSASPTDGATNNTVKNCILTGNAPTTTLAGIVSSSGTKIGDAAETANSNNTYQNNSINTCSFGVEVIGPTAGESGTILSNNLIGSATAANKIGLSGVLIANQTNVTVSNNKIFGVTTSTSSTVSGIVVLGSVSGGIINANTISDVKNTNSVGWGCNGICLSATSIASNFTVSNNMIFDIASYGFAGDASTDNGYGIILTSGGGYNVYYNSVSMNTNQTDTTGKPAAFNVTAGLTAANSINVRDNIFSNTQTASSSRYSIICEAANTVFTNIDYNDYSSGTVSVLGSFGGSNTVTLAAWKTATGKDVHSISVAPVFTSATDLHLVISSNCGIDHKGTPIIGITTDIDTDVRNASFPDIGADEFFNPTPVLSSNLAPSAICSGANFTYNPTSATSGATFTWNRATLPGITEPGTSGTGNVNDTLTNTSSASINVTFVYTTALAGCSNIQNVVVTVNPKPVLSSSLTPIGICSGSTFTYTATSASPGATFGWTRAAVAGISQVTSLGTGNVSEVLTNTTQVPVNVTYVYNITANGCNDLPGQNVVVTVSPVPALSSSLTPIVCSGSTFSYTPTSTTAGATFTWNRATVTGITEVGTAGTGGVSELLTNTTSSPINVTYVYATNTNGCTGGNQNVVVSVHPLPTVSLAAFTAPVCLQAVPFNLSGGAPAGGTYAGTGVNAGMFNPAIAGVGSQSITYTVTVSGCSKAASQILTVQSCTGIEENSFSQNVTLYPNPTNGQFSITIKNANFKELLISIVDIQGKEVYKVIDNAIHNGTDYNKQINLKALAKGIYFIKFDTGDDVTMQKLIIQ